MVRPSGDESIPGPSDPALAKAARAGDTAAFEQLWRRHARAGAAAARPFAAIADPEDIVSEAYLRIFRAVQRGGGPHEAFRPYLYRTIRNVALDWRSKSASVPLDAIPELQNEERDPADIAHERTITARAFATLPQRWQAALWYLDVEGMDPSEAAPLLGLTPNATSVLAIRAREGFKHSWLQAHVNDLTVPPECRWTTARMGKYSRGGLTRRGRERFDRHLETCTRCPMLVKEVDHLGGRLAGILLPIALGSTAGSALLAQLSADRATAASAAPVDPAPSIPATKPIKRVVSVVGACVLAVATITTAAAVTPLIWQNDNVSRTTPVEPDRPVIPTPPQSPEPEALPAQPPPEQTPPPHQPPVLRPPTPVSPPAPVLPPAPPLVVAPATGLLTNDPHPLFSGSGEPGARVDVQRLDEGTGELTTVLTTAVGSDGNWSALSAVALVDGIHELRVSQVNAAGKRSSLVALTIEVDTVALPPVMDPLPTEPMLFLPDITGTAEPGAAIELQDEMGESIGSTVADASGQWSFALPDPERDGASISTVQTDLAGNVSMSSVPTPALEFDRPYIPSPISGATVPSTDGSTIVNIELAGHAGMLVQVFVDGVSTGNTHTLESEPIMRVTAPLSDGLHTLGVRYIDPDSGRVGSVYTIEINIA